MGSGGVLKPFPHEDRQARGQAEGQAAQGGWAGSILAGFQDPAGQSPEQPGLTSQLALLGAGVHKGPPEVPSNMSYFMIPLF